MKGWKPRAALATVMALALVSCGNEAEDTAVEASSQTSATLAEAMADDGTLATASDAFSRTGLNGVLEGAASYTVLAPSDTAFEALGESARESVQDEESGAIVAAILREHMIPGALTPEDIRKSLANGSGNVSLTTFGDGTLSFRMDGDTIVVSNESGQTATIGQNAVIAKNGVVIPIDGVLADPQALR